MKIWLLGFTVNDYENLQWRDLDLDFINSFDGRSKEGTWHPVTVKRMYDREFSNAPGLASHIPVFDRKTIEILKNYMGDSVEILPLECVDGDFYAINVTNILDCIDYNKSEYKSFKDGRILRFIKYAFDTTKVSEQRIFKIVDEPLANPFVSDDFKNLVENNHLSGFKFELVWDSDI